MDNYKISVIMAAYNAADYIADAINSVLAQTYRDFEIVVVNDGSSDQTESILREYANTNPNILYETVSHAGVCRARNRAIELSGGEYLFFLDADDFIHPLLFEQMILAVRQTNAAMSSEYFCAVSSDASFAFLSDSQKSEKVVQYSYHNHEETVNDLFRDSPLSMIGGLLIKKEIAKEIAFDERFIIGEDKLYLYQCVLTGADYVGIPKRWYYNRIHKSNSSHNVSKKACLSRYMRRKYFWTAELENGRFDHADQEISEAFSILLQHFKKKKTWDEFAFISHLIRRDRYCFFRLPNWKIRFAVFCISYLNPILLFKKTTPELEIWKNTGLY